MTDLRDQGPAGVPTRAPIGRPFAAFAAAILALFVLVIIEPQLGLGPGLVRDQVLAERLGLVGATVLGVAAALTANRAVATASASLMTIATILGASTGWWWLAVTDGRSIGPRSTGLATAVAAVLAVVLLAGGLWRARWLGVFCGLGALGLTLASTLLNADVAGPNSNPISAPLALLVAVSAMTCLYGILVDMEVGEQRTGAELVAARRRVETEIAHYEEILHDLRSGLLSIEAAIATVDSDLSPPLRAEAARLRRLTSNPDPVKADQAAESGHHFDLVPGVTAMVAARRASGQPTALRGPTTLATSGREDEVLAAVENLLSNAHRHGRAPVVVELAAGAASRAPGSVTVSVSDGGGGFCRSITALGQRRVVSSHPSGQGIGLARTRRLATDNGGTLTVGPTVDGRTVFVLTLPSPDSEPDSQRSGPATPRPKADERPPDDALATEEIDDETARPAR